MFRIQTCAFMFNTGKHVIQVFQFIPLWRLFSFFSYNCPTGAQNQHPPAVSLHLFYCHTPALPPPQHAHTSMTHNKKLIYVSFTTLETTSWSSLKRLQYMKDFKYKYVLGVLISASIHTGGFNGASWKLPEDVCHV